MAFRLDRVSRNVACLRDDVGHRVEGRRHRSSQISHALVRPSLTCSSAGITPPHPRGCPYSEERGQVQWRGQHGVASMEGWFPCKIACRASLRIASASNATGRRSCAPRVNAIVSHSGRLSRNPLTVMARLPPSRCYAPLCALFRVSAQIAPAILLHGGGQKRRIVIRRIERLTSLALNCRCSI